MPRLYTTKELFDFMIEHNASVWCGSDGVHKCTVDTNPHGYSDERRAKLFTGDNKIDAIIAAYEFVHKVDREMQMGDVINALREYWAANPGYTFKELVEFMSMVIWEEGNEGETIRRLTRERDQESVRADSSSDVGQSATCLDGCGLSISRPG